MWGHGFVNMVFIVFIMAKANVMNSSGVNFKNLIQQLQ
jgi:hypothetical protein